ncbi:MAG: endopeptidase La [Lachnospiraceae bacterium]|nr:endopeptidase La [Lachnospiraceae bacterium]
MTTLTVVAMHDTILLPNVEYQMKVAGLTNEERERIIADDNRCLLLPMKKQTKRDDITPEVFCDTGVVIEVSSVVETPLGYMMTGRTRERAKVSHVEVSDTIVLAQAELTEEVSDLTAEGEKTLLDNIKNTTLEMAAYFKGAKMITPVIEGLRTINTYAARMGGLFEMTAEEKYALLVEPSLKARGMMIREALLRYKGSVDMKVALESMDDPEGRHYKKQAINRQIRILQKELEALDPEAAAMEDEYQKKIEEAHMPDYAREEAEKIRRRLARESASSGEYSSLANYLDFMTALPWEKPTEKPLDIHRAEEILNRDHYGLEKVKDRILEHLAVLSLNKEKTGSILLLVGPPGTGKTSMGRSVAEALKRAYVRVSLGGVRDESEIRGHRRTYIGSMPGRILQGIKRAGAMDPVVVLDEVDKLGAGAQGDPSAALLEVLDPEQNSTFTDHYLNLPYDLSGCFFICTANSTDTIPQPLLDRMEVIELQGYTPVEKRHIARRHLLKKAMADAGLTGKELRVADSALEKMIAEYTMEAGVRGLKKQLDTLCRKAAAKVVRGEKVPISVNKKNLEAILGRPRVHHAKAGSHNRPGVVTGLAWTMAGGEILFLESTKMKGSGHLKLTGQLGDVMKESAETAFSLVKSLLVDRCDVSETDIHIHVPAGAVPKDGPSAGITMVTTLMSLLTNREVPADLAMTGEISLRGEVMPIGGLPEKLMAAVRAGIHTVLIPAANEADLADVPEETLSQLTVHPVGDIHEVLTLTLGEWEAE